MKFKLSLISILFLFSVGNTQAQLMEKLKKRAAEKGIKTNKEVKYDSTAYDPNIGPDEEDFLELEINSVEEFYNKDVVMALYNENGQLVQTSFFDAQIIAMRTEQVNNPHPVYHDDTGKMYAYNNDAGQYESVKLLPSSSMGLMVSGMTTQAYKLPPTPYFEAFQALEKLGSGLNFIILEMAFIYKPEHFINNANYTLKKINCAGSNNCLRYNYNDPEYIGSYIQFDAQGLLRELNIISTNKQFTQDSKNSSGKFVFSYKPCTVKLPDAVEQSLIPGPLGKILPIEKGLEPWKYNKKDKKKKNNNH